MKNSSVNKLIQHLQNIYALPDIKKHNEHTHNLQPDEHSMKQQMSKNYRTHWKVNGVTHDNMNCQRLPIGDLDNWEILRINMSKRSYEYPRRYKGMKIPAVSREFNTFNGRGKNGQIPYMYESQLGKIQHIRNKIYSKPFKRTNTVKHDMFGFPDKIIPRSKSLAMNTISPTERTKLK